MTADKAAERRDEPGLAETLDGLDPVSAGSESFELAIEAFPGGFIMFGPDERLIACNTIYRRMYPEAAHLFRDGMLFTEILHEGIEAGIYRSIDATAEELFEKRLRGFRSPQASREQLLSDGRWVRIDHRRMADGSSIGLRTDITEMKRREADLAAALDRARDAETVAARQANLLKTILHGLPDGAHLFDAAGNMVAWNDLLFRINDLDEAQQQRILASDNVARTFRMTLATRGDYGPGDPAELVAIRERSAREQKARQFRRSSLTGRWLEVRTVPSPDGTWLGLYRDVSADVAREEELAAALASAQAASKAKGEFLANTSHELRTPLNAIIGFADLMSSGIGGPLTPTQREYLDFIRQGGKHLLAIINDILDLSKVEAGKLELHREEIDLHRLLDGCVQYLQLAAETGDVTIARAYGLDDPVLSVDPVRTRQIVINLLANAIKFSGIGKVVTLATGRAPDGAVEISIADHGIGMTEAELQVALEPFGQVESGLNRRFEGTGLGLPLARRMIEAHGGSLHVASGKDLGTTVTMRLPNQASSR
ncbi:MAG TPA: PAS-domain containing protein [Stellaceae bacterium]|nr:PAS-domain containing protein [Stellaceae bacterium]